MSELTREVSPEFQAFKALAADALAQRPDLLRLDCLNPLKAVAHEFDFAQPAEITLERAWRRYLGLRFATGFSSAGVRDSLFRLFAGPLNGRVVSIPSDVYPVYQTIAHKSGVRFETYPTLPDFDLRTALRTDTVLLTAPLTPLGRDLSETEITTLLEWLRAEPSRVLVVDRVYDYANRPCLQSLLDTEQAIVCYSLSKTHLAPLVSGFAIAPDRFAVPCADTDQADRAKVLLTRYSGFPQMQRSIFRARWHMLASRVRAFDPTWLPPETGYLSVVRVNHAALLARGILAVPGAVFGTTDDLCVISCLHETHCGSERESVDRFHVLPLSNFARGYDKYARTYSKAGIAESRYPDQFFLLPEDRLDIGFTKVRKLLQKTTAGDRPVVLHTRVERHELRPNERTGLGEFVARNHVRVVRLLDESLNLLRTEDAYAESLELNETLLRWEAVRPRSLSVLPIAQACQAKCDFCFSHSSVSEEQEQGRVLLSRLEGACAESRARGAERLVITGGGEPTLLAHRKLLEIIRTGSQYFGKVVLITNGYTLGHAGPAERLRLLRDYRDSGLTVLAVSRHSPDRNAHIMHVDTQSEEAARTLAENAAEFVGLTLRWVCVLQTGGVSDERTLREYLTWASATGAREVCFKELYVAASRESVYRDQAANEWSAEHQVPLSLVTEFLDANGAERVSELPWGAPVYRLNWRGRELTIAAYTEPSVFWERTNGLCRSWNLMADGTCYANLETTASRIAFGHPVSALTVLDRPSASGA